MNVFPVFLTVVVVVRNESEDLADLIDDVASTIAPLVSDYELIVVDNASEDASVAVLRGLAGDSGQPNLQVYALTKEVDRDTASWAGLENALGDFVAVLDPLTEDIRFLPEMLDRAAHGCDAVFAKNRQRPNHGALYGLAYAGFNRLYRAFGGINLSEDAPQYRVLNKRVVNYILQHPQPAIAYRHLPATGGFSRANLSYSALPRAARPRRLGESIDRGMRLLVSTTRAPMRLVTSLCLFGAAANLLYSLYVLAVGLLKADVAPGWVSLSLQQSGMFFLLSLVLLVLGEYILHTASLSGEGPPYHVGQEFCSTRVTRRERLNLEVVADATPAQTVGRSGVAT